MKFSIRNLLMLIVFMSVLLGSSAFAVIQGVRVSTPDTCWYTGNFIDVPINVEWTKWGKYQSYCPETEYSVPDDHDSAFYPHRCFKPVDPTSDMYSFQMELSFDSYRMNAVTATGSDIIEDWPPLYFEIDNSSGTIKISGASVNPINLDRFTDPTELVKVGFLISGHPGDNTDLKLISFQYNEVDPMYIYWGNNDVNGYDDAKSIGDLMVCEHEYLSGKITYCSNSTPICDAEVHLTYYPDLNVPDAPAIDNKMVKTSCESSCEDDCRGSYMMTDIIDGYDYCLSAWKDDDYDNAITAFDASLISRYVVGMLNLNDCQMMAADVSGDGTVSAFDASLILRYLVGRLPSQPYFPIKAADRTNWIFFADNYYEESTTETCYNPLTGSHNNQDFQAVILGDVSGNWGMSSAGKINAQKENAFQLKIASITSKETVYQLRSTYSNVYGCQFDIKIPEQTSDVRVINNTGWNFETNQIDGTIRVAGAGASSISDDIIAEIVVGQSSDINISIENMVVNESEVLGSILSSNQGGVLPSDFSLSDAYPNPFNPETNISFSLATKSKVDLIVYNLVGQKIKTIVSGDFEAGAHYVRWDGTNESNEKVSSGIYFYRLETSSFTQTKKMVLLK